MIILFRVHRAQDGKLVGVPGSLRQEFANLDARNIGGDWLKLAADLSGSLGFHVKGIQMGTPAALPNEYTRNIPRGSCAQYALQANPQSTQGANANKIAPTKKRMSRHGGCPPAKITDIRARTSRSRIGVLILCDVGASRHGWLACPPGCSISR